MPRKNRPVNPKAEDELDSLKEEVAEELHLDDDIEKRGWENMTTREVGKIGGNMIRKMINLAEEEMDKKDGKIKKDKSTGKK
ncbi:small, acid-soluble spore protein, alpha/beta type [Biomaibacter acetigenes]|uniref:Small, acid-soluble spore protein, alpha/beta type n=1 Tax=Biomaibacter acetigenes TaxID=2316383 RepID=A0A3G2R705_9FIRM|nr:alpha/beta-type small acid-soluble spore protein [Biomaibacter acetigenes]AYO30878.1 small, acid-soluble spore protein, alpha/beta type [Biomaibacter acetigenes]RKL62336.1 small acid-soluble spore protein [Thermoanaerobacteraceae bacterium SP2]